MVRCPDDASVAPAAELATRLLDDRSSPASGSATSASGAPLPERSPQIHANRLGWLDVAAR